MGSVPEAAILAALSVAKLGIRRALGGYLVMIRAMRQVWITKAGKPEVLQVREAPDPEARAGEVRIRVKAAGVNFADLMARVGIYPDAPPIPCVVGYEVAGTVDQIGAGVFGLAPGDRVLAMTHFGGYSDVVVAPSIAVLRIPKAMSFEEGAALPVNYLTAHHMMMFVGRVRSKSKVLIHSAAGGVGLAAIQLARSCDCVIFGTGSPSKHEFLRSQGVHHPLDSHANISTLVRQVIGDRSGLDLILDPVGGRSWSEGYDLLDACGRLVMFGFSAAAGGETRNILRAAREFVRIPRFSPMRLMTDNKEVCGVNIGHLFGKVDLLRPQLEELLQRYERGQVKPHVDRAFPFAAAPAAHRHLHSRQAIGKVLLVP